jgi:5-oxoprolinase (ATP-hydrolysing)/N-methylhydantoinase A
LSAYRVAVDIGGTFTDLVLQDARDQIVGVHKVLTTPADPTLAILSGVQELLSKARIEAAGFSEFIHATTLVTNTLIERTGAKVGLVTTLGFRDILEMRTESRYDLYDLFLRFPDPLVPRRLRYEVAERIDAQGRTVTSLDADGVRRAVKDLVERCRVESLAVMFLHAYLNPDHEQQVGAIVREMYPSLPVSLSSSVQSEIREYPRVSTTVANAYVQPKVREYLGGLSKRLGERFGYVGPVFIMLSSGGLTDAAQAAEFPARICESGPAAGVVATTHLGRAIGERDLVAFDMGGTTAKISVIVNGVPAIVPQFEVARVQRFKRGSGMPLRVPSVELIEIGAGGGSIAWLDSTGLLEVGPRSAGAEPGPACYRRGGAQPTVTDANLVLGFLDPEYFLGGRMKLDVAAAREALAGLAGVMQMTCEQAAWSVYEIVTEKMAVAARMHIVERGFDPRAFTYVAFGGAGPLHACWLAEKLGAKRALVPMQSGVASAVGLLVAPMAVDVSMSRPEAVRALTGARLRSIASELEGRAGSIMAPSPGAAWTMRWAVDARYEGQGHEVLLELGALPPDDQIAPTIQRIFDETYARTFGRTIAGRPIEVVTWRLRVEGRTARPAVLPPRTGEEIRAPKRMRQLWFGGQPADGALWRRDELPAGVRVHGPALIQEAESTTVVPPNWVCEADAAGHLILEATQ